ncbi:MAG: aminopeptidase P family protein [Alphaproteobacteria bacterium]
MFQNFEEPATSAAPARMRQRVGALRAVLKKNQLDGFIVPRSDAYQCEYVSPRDERLAWISGFSGSAGIAIVLAQKAAVFSDGRYTAQMAAQVDGSVFDLRHITETPPTKWLGANLKPGANLGYDPWLHTSNQVAKLAKAAKRNNTHLVGVPDNPIDQIWAGRPPAPNSPVLVHGAELAGQSSQAKLEMLRATLAGSGHDAVVLTQPDAIAWLFNIRGSDVAHLPVVLCFSIVTENSVTLFIAPDRLSAQVVDVLGAHVAVRPPGEFLEALQALGDERRTVRLDPATAAHQIALHLEKFGATVAPGTDPCLVPRAKKNNTEIAGARAAHARDAVPMARFLAWIDAKAQTGTIDEIGAATRLEALRAETNQLRDISFDTISGAGAHGAIVHYRVTTQTNQPLVPGSLYLVDSGAQYRDGTTDITRTVAIGTPTAQMRRHFTLVLKGHIALATARFPAGTTGGQLDALARTTLWQAGLDYDHGTGHGVGSFLSVHEGPQRISKSGGSAVLHPGMIISNEPGYYRPGEYGIRIENLLLVREPREIDGGDRPMLEFETLSFTPIDRALIDTKFLSDAELAWLNAYHARCLELVSDRLDEAERAWVAAATAPIQRDIEG